MLKSYTWMGWVASLSALILRYIKIYSANKSTYGAYKYPTKAHCYELLGSNQSPNSNTVDTYQILMLGQLHSCNVFLHL